MHELTPIFEKIGLGAKEQSVYLTLLRMGPRAIRKIADESGVNRGSVYEALKKLQDTGLISYFHKGKRQHFVAEDPTTLSKILSQKKKDLAQAVRGLSHILPKLSSLTPHTSHGPVIKFYEDYVGIRQILEDVLVSLRQKSVKEYAVYSSLLIRPHLYHKKAFPDFTKERIKQKIFVRTIASGKGGQTHGNDARKTLSTDDTYPTYKLIYAGKIAAISINTKGIPHGFIIEDNALYHTELSIFNTLWDTI